MGPREATELMTKSEDLEEEVPMRAQRGTKQGNRPRRESHWPQNGWQLR